MQKKSLAAKGSRTASRTKSGAKSVVRKARPTKKQVKQVKEVSKNATHQYTRSLLKKGAKVLEQGVERIAQGAEKLGNVLRKSFRSA